MRHPVAHIESRVPYKPRERNNVYICKVLFTVTILRLGVGSEMVPPFNFPSICNKTMELIMRYSHFELF